MNRRGFLAASVGAVVRPDIAGARDPGKVYRVAALGGAFPALQMTEAKDRNFKGFFEELRRLGFEGGRNLGVERRSAEGKIVSRGVV
jgi:hypothetical protein